MLVYIKDWFLSKKESELFRGCQIIYSGYEVVRETEKACLVNIPYNTIDGEFEGSKNVWVPKSCVMSAEEYKSAAVEKETKKATGLERNIKILEFAKENGIKGVRKGMKTATLLQKINAAGLVCAL